MNAPPPAANKLTWLLGSVHFIRQHFLVIAGLGLLSGIGRVIQLGSFGEISSFQFILLEIIIELARVILFLYVLGFANVKDGLLRLKRLFIHKNTRKLNWALAKQNLKKERLSLIINLFGFLLIAAGVNFLIDLLAYQTCLYLTLKSHQILAESSSEWTILLFFKNISIIPFTLVFEAIFLLWITGKFKSNKHYFINSL
ncbi:hypothetical protein [Adhaeribacter pallidiroseus]|uniref:Uncharacterized protein n=1 Tax=Adhaeribacter pallidiroseus TaxID=2072847 RepID=A0A369QGV1_9BACT|nr:hypothetical protein [Adhaeribacter pallidiroseus]RDC62119.1 hypothetical protein AHMF7616_00710 [Adhaeribacter pallidiroseus]